MTALRFTSGAREGLKWAALALMTGDHVNAALFGRDVHWLFWLGRIVMPLFAAIITYNMARDSMPRPDWDPEARMISLEGRYSRALQRLALIGAVAYPFHVIALGQGWGTANILFGYALAIVCMWLSDRWGWLGRSAAAIAIAIGGLYLEFVWAAPLVTLAWWVYWRHHQPGRLDAPVVALSLAKGLLCVVNGNAWALLALPVVFLLREAPWTIQRRPWAFYVYYPAHLVLLAMLMLAPAPYISMVSIPPVEAVTL